MTAQDPATPAPNQGEAPAELIEYKKRLEAENKVLREQLTATHLGAIGLEPDKGLGKAISQTFKGDPSAEAIATFARDEYGHELPPPAVDPAQAEAIQAAQAAQAASQSVQMASAPLAPATQTDQLRAHDQRLAEPDATAADAKAAITDKVGALMDRIQ